MKVKKWHCARQRRSRTDEISYICPHKGRLASKTLDMFEKIGITCEEMRDKDSRKLIFTNEELKLKFSLQKVRMCRLM